MLKNYILIALRNFKKQKSYSTINILGLAVGVALFILIANFIIYELSFDKFNVHADRIYRVIQKPPADEANSVAVTQAIAAPYLAQKFPEIQSWTRFFDRSKFRPVIVRYNNVTFNERSFYYADSSTFKVFSFEFISGSPNEVLTRPNTIVITESMAKKYFKNENPLGKSLVIDNQTAYEITGIIKDIPKNSHIKFDFLASNKSLSFLKHQEENWDAANFYTYFLLRENVNPAQLQNKIKDITEERVGREHLSLQALTDIHLRSNERSDIAGHGSITSVYIFGSIAILIILIASINYINLSTARSVSRAREVGLRKVLGAVRSHLIKQFYIESTITVVISFIIGILLAEVLLPIFNEISQQNLSIEYLSNPTLLFVLLVLAVFVSLFSGSYPAYIISSFQPVKVLKGKFSKSKAGQFTREGLVVFQFTISVVLIVSALVVTEQLSYMQNKNLGFDKEHVLVIPVPDKEIRNRIESLTNILEKEKNVSSASAVKFQPGNILSVYGARAEGMQDGDYLSIYGNAVDNNFISTVKIDLVAGKNFTNRISDTSNYQYILNESAVKELGWNIDEAIGKQFAINPSRKGYIVGVAKDFNYASLHRRVEPLALYSGRDVYSHILVKLNKGNLPDIISGIKNKLNEFAPNLPFDYKFLDDEFDEKYKSETITAGVVNSFSILAILISCLGLFGLVSFVTNEKRREIGIRKVLGASMKNLLSVLTSNFFKVILMGFVIGSIVAYYLITNWLNDFPYKIELDFSYFILTAIALLFITIMTASYQTIKTALTNPIKVIREE